MIHRLPAPSKSVIPLVMVLVMAGGGGALRQSVAFQGQADDDAPRLHLVEARSHGKTPPLRELKSVPLVDLGADAEETSARPRAAAKPSTGGGGPMDPDLQTTYPSSAPPAVGVSFDGIAWNGYDMPPDTNLAVGDTQVVEMVNAQFAVYDKAGTLVQAPAPLTSLFASLGPTDPCVVRHGGDPIVLYDKIAGRWLVNHLVYATSNVCIAISATSDATGAYYVYNFPFPNIPDYPKFGVWTDAYYFSANSFTASGTFVGANVCAFDRQAMAQGLPAPAVCFQNSTKVQNALPADLDSAALPPPGSPGFFLQLGSNALSLYKFHVDFVTPSRSTFTGPTSIAVGRFANAGAIPQPNGQTLESLGSRLMYRLAYRNFGGYESLTATHSVQVALNGSGTQTGIRWYELRNPNGTPVVRQQSTFSPDTTTYRWLGSMAQDKQGNMLLGYNASSSTVQPGIRFTARLASDPLNQMQREVILQPGFGSQVPTPGGSGRNRWGDYGSVAVDPIDGCTFWLAGEYLPYNGYNNWVTRIASARFPGCS